MSIQSTWKHAVLVGTALEVGVFTALAQGSGDAALVQYGTMHDVLAKKNHQGRVAVGTLVEQPHFFGVAAVQALKGEITVFDSDVTVTGVTADGRLEALERDDLQATLLIGAYVPAWTEYRVERDVPAAGFDDLVREAAVGVGVDVTRPFVFTVEGGFSDVKIHVINGACPVHARLKNIEIPKEQIPFEGRYPAVTGRLVGVYASDAVGKLTHPATSTHVHLIFDDEALHGRATGHVEQVGLAAGAVLRLPSRG